MYPLKYNSGIFLQSYQDILKFKTNLITYDYKVLYFIKVINTFYSLFMKFHHIILVTIRTHLPLQTLVFPLFNANGLMKYLK